MIIDDLEAHLREIGHTVENLTGGDGNPYIVVRKYRVPAGSLSGTTCDLAIQRTSSVPFVMPSAIHTRPALIAMGNHNTQGSGIGPEWQYWSRTLRVQPSPEVIVAHIATIFAEI